MSNESWRRGLVVSTVLVAILALVGTLLGAHDPQPPHEAGPTPAPTPSVSEQIDNGASGPLADQRLTSDDLDRLADEIAERVNDAPVAIGTQVDHDANPLERGEGALNETRARVNGTEVTGSLRTAQEVANRLGEDELLRTAVVSAIEEAGYGDYVDQALSGECYFPLQVLVDAGIVGNGYIDESGNVAFSDTARHVEKGDVVWLCLIIPDEDDLLEPDIVWGATVRADCDNPGLEEIIPEPEPEPTPSSTPTPKCFDAQGRPVYDGEFCGTPTTGPEQQPVDDNNPEHTAPTDGYNPGNAEEVANQQEEDAQAVRDGDQDWHEPTEYGQEANSEESATGNDSDSVESEPESSASDNPRYDGSEPSQEGNEGVTNDPNEESSQTSASDDGNSDERNDPNDNSSDQNSGQHEGEGDKNDQGSADGDPCESHPNNPNC